MNPAEYRVMVATDVVKLVLQGVPDRPGMAAEIFNHISQTGVNVELVVQTARHGQKADLALVVLQDYAERTREQLERLQPRIAAEEILLRENVALITLEKDDLSKTPGAAARMFRTLAAQGINIDLISTSLSCISCLIPANRAEEARRALMAEFTHNT